MTTLIGATILVLIFGVMADSHVFCYNDMLYGTRYEIQKRYLFPVLSVFLIVGGFRFYVGSDFHAYYVGYITTWQEIIIKIQNLEEPLIWLLNFLIRTIYNNNQFVIFIYNAIIIILVFKGVSSHDGEKYCFPLLLYMFYGGWLFSFSGIRQALALSILFAFTHTKGEHWIRRYLISGIIAFLIHRTALLIIPILIIAKRRLSYLQTFIMIVTILFIAFFGSNVVQIAGIDIEKIGVYGVETIHPLRVVVAFVPAILILFLKTQQKADLNEEENFLFNMVLVNAALVLVTSGSAYMNRISYYTVIYSIVAIPKVIRLWFGDNWKFYSTITGLLFFAFFCFESSGIQFRWHFF